jgi:hypothetical protein
LIQLFNDPPGLLFFFCKSYRKYPTFLHPFHRIFTHRYSRTSSIVHDDVMTLSENDLTGGSLYSIKKTEDRGRAVYASNHIPAGTTVHVASQPFVSVIKEKFKREVCAWCFKYQNGKNWQVKHSDPQAGLWFCSVECLHRWVEVDYDGKLAAAWASLRSNKARKVKSYLSSTKILAYCNIR